MQEAETLVSRLQEEDPSVGDAVLVEYDEKFAKQHSIGRFGRMTMKTGEPLFHAAPAQVVRDFGYQVEEHDFFDYVKRWRRGDEAVLPMRKAVEGPKFPEKVEDYRKLSPQYERSLFFHLGQSHEITLVNPSFSTMVSLKTTVGGYVTLTATMDHDWVVDVVDFVAKSGGKLKLLESKQVYGIAYLGSNVPVWFPDTPWVRFIISPFLRASQFFPSYMVEFREDCVVSSYQKKRGYTATSILSRDESSYLYNPETVDAWLGQKGGMEFFFLSSNLEFELEEKNDSRVRHSPWMINIPKDTYWLEMDNLLFKVKGLEVFDVQGRGTYLSRRQRLSPNTPFYWTPIVKTGTHWVTYSTIRPQKISGISVVQRGEQKMVVFGNAKLINEIQVVEGTFDGTFWTAFSRRIDIPAYSWPLYSDDGVRMFLLTPKQRLRYKEDLEMKLHVCNTGQVFLPRQRSDDGVLYAIGHTEDLPIPLLPNGRIHPTVVYRTSLGDYVEWRYLGEEIFVFPRLADIEKMSSTLSLFSTRWVSVRSLMEGSDEPAMGGQVSSDLFLVRLVERLKQSVVTSKDSEVSTVSQIARDIGASSEVVYRTLQRLPGVYLWSQGTIPNSQFVHVESMLVRAEGRENNETADGKKWTDLMFPSGVSMKYTYTFVHRSLRPLIHFLRINYYYVVVKERGLEVDLKIRCPKRQ